MMMRCRTSTLHLLLASVLVSDGPKLVVVLSPPVGASKASLGGRPGCTRAGTTGTITRGCKVYSTHRNAGVENQNSNMSAQRQDSTPTATYPAMWGHFPLCMRFCLPKICRLHVVFARNDNFLFRQHCFSIPLASNSPAVEKHNCRSTGSCRHSRVVVCQTANLEGEPCDT